MVFERTKLVEIGIVHQALDVLQGKAKLAIEQDLLQFVNLLRPVHAIARLGDARRFEQPDFVVVAQGPCTDPRKLR